MVNPACMANADDGSSRYRVVERPIPRNATRVTEKAIERPRVHNQLRQEPDYSSEATYRGHSTVRTWIRSY
eukprot:2255401-Pyramimonas_sp.AAC.1